MRGDTASAGDVEAGERNRNLGLFHFRESRRGPGQNPEAGRLQGCRSGQVKRTSDIHIKGRPGTGFEADEADEADKADKADKADEADKGATHGVDGAGKIRQDDGLG